MKDALKLEDVEEQAKKLVRTLKKVSNFKKIKFIILYGSYAYGKPSKLSDYDFCIYYDDDKKERFDLRIKLLGNLSSNFDIQVFQDLPLYVRKEVLRGKLIYYKDLSFVYDTAYETIKAFNDFKYAYYDYIGMEKIR